MSLLKFRMTFTLTVYLEKSPSPNRDFPFTSEMRQNGIEL